jgi:hypothetical protein
VSRAQVGTTPHRHRQRTHVEEAIMGGTDDQRPESTDEIAAERERRLAPENRPDNAEVDNSNADLPTVEEFARANAGDEQEGSAGRSDPSEPFRENPPSDEEVEDIKAERERRLDPANRPDNVEVDNTGRTFDAEQGEFVDDDRS